MHFSDFVPCRNELENGPNNNKPKAYDAPIHSGNSGRYLEHDAPHFLFYVQEKAGRKIYAPLFQDFTPILQTLRGSFSAASTPMFASKYSLESSRRDLHDGLLCTVLVGSVWVKKYTKINIEKMKSSLISIFSSKIANFFCD